MKLISMTEFVLEQEKQIKEKESYEFTFGISDRVFKYANFINKPLKLEILVPCDEDGNVLEEPKKHDYKVDVNIKCNGWKYLYDSNDKLIGYYDDRKWKENFVKFKQAKEKVLFEGFELVSETEQTWIFKIKGEFPRLISKDGKIEWLQSYNNITLTPNAIKQLGL